MIEDTTFNRAPILRIKPDKILYPAAQYRLSSAGGLVVMRNRSVVSIVLAATIVLGAFYWIPLDSTGAGIRMDFDLKDAHASFWGEDSDDNAGSAVSGAGDVNGDGFDDLLIGAYLDEDGGASAGQTYLVLGGSDGWSIDSDLSNADASFWGEDAGDYSGFKVAGAGDVNGDGYDDILIGAYGDDDGGSSAGQTYLILGKASGWSMDTDLSSSDASFWGEDADDHSGYSVSGTGDVNGDGFDDILIGAMGDDDGGSNAGQTYLILGKASGWSMDTDLSLSDASFRGEDADDHSGHSVSGAGDVNGDGFDDILIGAYGDEDGGGFASGQTYLIFGRSTGWSMDTDLSSADASFWGEDPNDYSGWMVSGSGDVNGDGYSDILIGAYGDDDAGSDAGQTYLILGRVSPWNMDTSLSDADASFWGEDSSDRAGVALSCSGDVNGDGFDDILIGASRDEDGGSNSGQTYLVLGKASGWSMDTSLRVADASFWGEVASDYSGSSFSISGDVNGDGFDDILIGAWGDDDGGSSAGQTYLIFYETRPPAPHEVTCELSVDGGSLALEWNVSGYWKDLTGFNIYRSTDGEGYSLHAGVNSTTFSFEDTDVILYRYYRYFITSKSHPELESSHSGAVEVMNDMDSDADNIGDMYDRDILGPLADLQADIDYMNSTLFPVMNDIWNKVDYTNRTLFPTLNDVWNIVSYMNSTSSLYLQQIIVNLIALRNDVDQDHAEIILLLGENNNHLRFMNSSFDYKLDLLLYLVEKIEANITGLNGTVSLKLDDMMALVIENNNNINYMNTSFDLDLNTIQNLVMWLRDMVSDLGIDLDGVNNTLHQELSQLAADLSSHDQRLSEFRDALEINITTIISLMNTEWSNITVVDSAVLSGITTNLTSIRNIVGDNNNDLAFLNGSITLSLEGIVDDLGTVISNLEGVNNTLRDRLDLIRTDMLSHIADFQEFNTSIEVDIATLLLMLSTLDQDVEDLDAGLSADLQALSSLISRMDLNVTTLGLSMAAIGGQIDITMQEIIGDIADLDVSLKERIDDLEFDLTADILSLHILVESANRSLHQEISGLEAEISTMRADVVDGLGDMIVHLEGMEGNLAGEIDVLEVLVEEIDSASLALLSERLDMMAAGLGENDTTLMELISDLGSKLDLLDLTVSERLENISSIMATMDELDVMTLEISEIGYDLETLADLEEALSNVEGQQEDTSSKISMNSALLWFIMLICVIMIGFMIYIAFWKRGSDEGIDEVTVPPPPSKVSLDMDDDGRGPQPPSRVEIEDDAQEDGIRWDD